MQAQLKKEPTLEIENQNTNSTKQKTVVPKNWGFENPQANQLMAQKAKSLVKNLKKIYPQFQKDQKNYTDLLFCFEKYIKSFKRSVSENKVFIEAKSSHIKEKVMNYAKELAKEHNVEVYLINNLWENVK
jgi:hypothetical protein